MTSLSRHTAATTLAIVAVLFFGIQPSITVAQSVDELRDKIDTQQGEIQQLEAEIAQYEKELQSIAREKQTLESAVRELDVARQQVSAKISLAQRQINSTSATIDELSADIEEKERGIERNSEALAEALRRMHESESQSMVEVILGSDTVATLWDDVEALQQFQTVVRNEATELAVQKQELETARVESTQKQAVLVDQKTELASQQHALDINRSAKNELLEETENEESNYQQILADKRAAKAEFEAQLRDYEAQLQYQLDPTKIPPAGKGVLRYPLDSVTITQYFGNTRFAQSGAYSGQGHNGIDLRATIGTPVKAALAGNIKATGNTDAIRGCYSYGKWVLVEHVNGLTTLYAHLSDIRVSKGQAVNTGTIIGYSGNTGYSTGPHLHFTVYASEAVEIVRLGDIKSRTNCADALVPVAPYDAYLNPLDYL